MKVHTPMSTEDVALEEPMPMREQPLVHAYVVHLLFGHAQDPTTFQSTNSLSRTSRCDLTN